MNKPLYEIDLRKFRKKYDSGDSCMLEYIKDYISSDLMDLYHDVLNYNEIYANGWTIESLFEMGEEDKYWTNRANFFIEKYNVPKKDYNEFGKYFDEYMELRDNLLDDMGLSMYIDKELSLEDILPGGIVEYENITNPSEMNDVDSYTVARVRNFGHCVELHYSGGEATIEYGYKVNYDCWEDGIEEVDWFNKDMTEEEIINKLQELFDYHYGEEHGIQR